MRLDGVTVFGDVTFRGQCPTESVEQVTFFNRIRREYPTSWGRLAFHPRNEGIRTIEQAKWQKAEGLTAGTVDVFIPARVAFVCEMKRQDHTKSAWQPGQVEYLQAAQEAGAFACVALGYLAAWEALETWLKSQAKS